MRINLEQVMVYSCGSIFTTTRETGSATKNRIRLLIVSAITDEYGKLRCLVILALPVKLFQEDDFTVTRSIKIIKYSLHLVPAPIIELPR